MCLVFVNLLQTYQWYFKTEITQQFYHLIASQDLFSQLTPFAGYSGPFLAVSLHLDRLTAGLDYLELTIYFWQPAKNLNWKILWLILPHRLNTKYAEKISGEKVFWIVKCDAIFLVGMHFCPSSITGPRVESGSWKKCIQKREPEDDTHGLNLDHDQWSTNKYSLNQIQSVLL